MKILVVCQYFHPEQFRVNDICYELVKEGHEVTVLTGLPNYPKGKVDPRYRWFKNRREIINGVRVYRTWLIGRGKGNFRLGLNYMSFVLSSLFKVVFMKKGFDLILVYQLSPVTMAIPGIAAKKLSKKPLVIYCHDLWPESVVSGGVSRDSRSYRFLLKLSKWIYGNADRIFTSSRLFERYFRSVLGISEDIQYLPVYAEEVFDEIPFIEKSNQNVDLIFAGNIGEMQSVETIIFAANELKEYEQIKFHILGDGSSRKKCEDLVNFLQLKNVTFYGQYPVSEMPRFYSMADAFLVTLKANEFISYTLPNKVQSYMASGRAIIGAVDGETQQIIEEADCGICGPAEDYKELANNIIKFYEEKNRRRLFGENARKYYDLNFAKSKYMERLNSLLEKTI